METDGGGWTVIQRRNASLGRVNFVRDWKNYENGFGDLDGEYWIGLNNIYELTNQQRMKLRMTVWNDTSNSYMGLSFLSDLWLKSKICPQVRSRTWQW